MSIELLFENGKFTIFEGFPLDYFPHNFGKRLEKGDFDQTVIKVIDTLLWMVKLKFKSFNGL